MGCRLRANSGENQPREETMPLTVGAVIFVVIVCLILGKGSLKNGFLRFYAAQWILLAVYLLFFGGVIAYAICEEIHDYLKARELRITRQINQTHSLKHKSDNGLLVFAGNAGNGVKDDG